MTTATEIPATETMADLLSQLGDIPPRRVLLRPAPGTATEKDLLRQLDHGHRLCELIEGTLVEKKMSALTSNVAARVIYLLSVYLESNQAGELFGPDGPFRLSEGLVRLPDVTFILRENLPSGQIPAEPIPGIAPDLAIEVLSESNTRLEMTRKIREYFQAGTTLVWEVDPERRVVVVYTAPDASRTLTESDTLEGEPLLPGLTVPVRRIFERLPPAAPPPANPTRSRKKAKE